MNLKRLNFKALFSALLISAVGTFTMGQITVLPVIDGDDSEAAWDAATEYAIEAVIADDFIDDAADLSGTFKLLWSADSVYVAVNVLDDSLYSLATNAYENDNVGIFFDLLNMKTGSYVDETQFYYEKNWWDGPDPIGARHGAAWATPPFGDFATTVDTSTSYLIELSFAWDQFGVTPVVGHQIGFDVKLSDNDGDGATPSEGRCQLAWSDTTDTGWNVPSVFGTLILKADGDVTLLPTIDGDASDDAWAMAPAYDITNVIADDFIDDAADLSGTFKVIWTSEDIYVLCEVQDDSLYSLATNAYENDNIGIFFDLLNKKTNSYVDTTQFYYEKNWWDGPDPIGARFGNAWATPPYNEFATTVDTGTSYLIEISLSWDRFGVDPMVGHQIGFDVKLSDNDGDGATPSEGRCQLAWSDTTDTGWNVPGVFGTLVLDKNGSVTVLPSVDGDGSDDVWDLVPAFEITNVIADDFIDDEADLSGITKLLWTSQSVFALVEVQDDSLYSLATNAYENDNVGIFFDLLNKKTNSYVDTTQFYYEKNWWDGPDPIGARFGNAWATPPYNEFATTVDTGTSYLIEISFDWARFGVTPIVGEEFGYDVKLSDNDGDGATPSEGRCQLAWSDTTDTGWNVPRVFGELILKADGTFATFTRPDQPDTLIAAVSEDTVVSLSWTAVDGADGYNLYRDDVLIAAGVNDESYVDNVPAESATYTYGVRAVVDGIKSLATEAVVDIVVGIHESTLAGLEVFPIPATNFVNINIESEILSISVYNVTGQLVKQLNNLNTSQYQLDLNGLSSGMYILNINAVEGYDIVRIIKQ